VVPWVLVILVVSPFWSSPKTVVMGVLPRMVWVSSSLGVMLWV